MPPHTNRLHLESSPYLLQHAHDPVDWHPWGEEAFTKAREEGKLVLVSVGYSSCHWCHVMEHESFEDPELAALLNTYFVPIKVDREERPDVDHVYMNAVQLMTRHGGWPLNCFTLPDGRPIHGGTYFKPDQWRQVLEGLARTWREDPARVLEYAERLAAGVRASDLIRPTPAPDRFDRELVRRLTSRIEEQFDRVFGGTDRVPKFPLPGMYEYLLQVGSLIQDPDLLAQVRLTLDKMEQGGIFDQVGGGFARYSVDARWKVPHFEKMLYDNAQLLQLYAKAYQAFGEPAYRRTVERLITFLDREMIGPEGSFQSAIDADSQGEEGRFYVWTAEELGAVLGEEAPLAKAYYCVDERGYWEHGRHILLRDGHDRDFAERQGMTLAALHERIDRIDSRLLEARARRIRPATDHKVLTAWNAMTVTALCHAADALGDPSVLARAQRTMDTLLRRCARPEGGLWRTWTAGRAAIPGFLDDHAHAVEALVTLYQTDLQERWLDKARELTEHVLAHYQDPASGLFWSTSDQAHELISRPMDVFDSVTPAANSTMARALDTLGRLTGVDRYITIATRQLGTILPRIPEHPSGHTNWGMLLLARTYPLPTIAISGPEAITMRQELGRHYIPQRIIVGTTGTSALPDLVDRPAGSRTLVHVCEDHTCQLPVASIAEALAQLP